MLLKKENLNNFSSPEVEKPNIETFNFPEKILQFGTGVLLRGLCDYYIDNANKKGIFKGRIAVVKSTPGENEFAAQDNLYTVCVRGMDAHGKRIEENLINGSISRVLKAETEWGKIVEIAISPDLEIVLSNTTEIGIVYSDEKIKNTANVPISFPSKLLFLLHKRYTAFKGDMRKGLIIIPTELVTDNGNLLGEIILKQAIENAFEEDFIRWLKTANSFCNSLVDRIVPGKPKGSLEKNIAAILPYEDNQKIVVEAYNLWAIEADEKIKEKLSFAAVNPEIIIQPDINIYRELKLRLLNGAHSFHAGLAFLAGFDIVRASFTDPVFIQFAHQLIYDEIAVAIPYPIDDATKQKFAHSLFTRFVNPYLEHKWLDITLHATYKMRARNIPLILNYYATQNKVPLHMAAGFAAYIRFMKGKRGADGSYFGESNGAAYPIQDSEAKWFSALWQNNTYAAIVTEVLKQERLWGTNLNKLPEFNRAVTKLLEIIDTQGVEPVLTNLNQSIYVQ